MRAGTAKLLTLLHPQTGQVRVKGVERTTNAILHPWLKSELESILATLPPARRRTLEETRLLWKSWQQDMTVEVHLGSRPGAFKDGPGLGQPNWSPQRRHCVVALPAWHYAAICANQGELVKYAARPHGAARPVRCRFRQDSAVLAKTG